MIIPINGHVLIEPVVHESFISSQKETYEEIGIVLAFPNNAPNQLIRFNIGDKVYFDSWLAAKYPKENGEFYWLIKYGDIRAYEAKVPEIELP